ncbi:MAG: DUF1566 domain-containing protein [Gammaproteobacteria bacterium]|nr:DUF1566 domain-containing protein [Gammaproteobacteria bacterium]
MQKHACELSSAVALTLLIASPVQAALVERLGGLAYYDTVIDVTWLGNANLAAEQTFGVAGIVSLPGAITGKGADGTMSWDVANQWVARMNAVRYLGSNQWRLPTMIDTGAPGCDFSNAGTDCGWNVQTTENGIVYSEMASLYYDTLGNAASVSPSGAYLFSANLNIGPFSNFSPNWYWLGLQYSPGVAWSFAFYIGEQDGNAKMELLNVEPVVSGDPFRSVPLPPALPSVLAALAAMYVGRQFRRVPSD